MFKASQVCIIYSLCCSKICRVKEVKVNKQAVFSHIIICRFLNILMSNFVSTFTPKCDNSRHKILKY